MELLNSHKPRLLTNHEVLNLIKEKLEAKKKIRSQQTLLYTSSKYLNTKSPCKKQTATAISRFIKEVQKFNLLKSEIMMLINHCPSTQVELSVMIADLDSRVSASAIEDLLNLIRECFPEGVSACQNLNTNGCVDETVD